MCTQPPYNDKNPPSAFFLSPQIISTFWDQAVHRFLAKWRNFAQTVDKHCRFIIAPPCVSCNQSAIVSPPEQV